MKYNQNTWTSWMEVLPYCPFLLEVRDHSITLYWVIIRVNSQKEFICTSNCNLNLRESRRDNHKDSDLRKSPIWEKPQERGKEFAIF